VDFGLVPIINSGFEDPVLADGKENSTTGFTVPGWVEFDEQYARAFDIFNQAGASIFDLVPPPGVTALKAGDYVEAELVRFYVPKYATNYAGPDAHFRNAVTNYQNTYLIGLREAVRNSLAVVPHWGTLERLFPVQIQATNNRAAFTVTGGIGSVPVTVTGLSDYRAPLLKNRSATPGPPSIKRSTEMTSGNATTMPGGGLYAQAGGEWKGQKYFGIGERPMNRTKIPPAEYATLAGQFNPTNCDAREWVASAKAAGMRYIVITAKHHDGFAMFKSTASPFNLVAATPFQRDPLKELAVECQKRGLKLCIF